jgi:hypothetical protein
VLVFFFFFVLFLFCNQLCSFYVELVLFWSRFVLLSERNSVVFCCLFVSSGDSGVVGSYINV